MAFEAYLKIDGIGISNESGIALESFSWGVSNPATPTSGQEGGRASFSDFSFAARVGQQSPQLFEKCAEGAVLSSAMLTIAGAAEQIIVKFSEVLVSSYQLNEQSLQKIRNEFSYKAQTVYTEAPVESVSLNFAKIEYQFGGTIGSGGTTPAA